VHCGSKDLHFNGEYGNGMRIEDFISRIKGTKKTIYNSSKFSGDVIKQWISNVDLSATCETS